MELAISFVRNFLCVCKSLLPQGLWVSERSLWIALPVDDGNPKPPDETMMFSPIETAIGILQLVGAALSLYQGWKGISDGWRTAAGIVRWRAAVKKAAVSGSTLSPPMGSAAIAAAVRVEADGSGKTSAEGKGNSSDDGASDGGIRRKNSMDSGKESLLARALAAKDARAKRAMTTAVCQLVIGVGFAYLGLFSFRLVGEEPVMESLVAMLAALVVLLWWWIRVTIRAHKTARNLKGMVQAGTLTAHQLDDVPTLGMLAPLCKRFRWEPDCEREATPAAIGREAADLALLQKAAFAVPPEAALQEANRRATQVALDAAAIALNVVAFLGYLAIPVTYYLTNEHVFVYYVPFWPGHQAAAWWGNLAGDIAWTVEPALAFVGGWLVAEAAPPKKKAD